METVACKDAAECSCLLANLLAELEQPCGHCRQDGVVMTGRSPTGEPVTVCLLPDFVLEVEGCDDILEQIRGRRCPHGP